MTSELLLMAIVAGERVVLRAAEVRSVIMIDRLTAVPHAPVHVGGLCALRSRILTAIDCRASLALPAGASPGGELPAIVVEHEGHGYALLVDAVEDVTEALSAPEAVPARLGRGWSRIGLGMVETGQGPLLLIDPARLVDGPTAGPAAGSAAA